MSILADPLVNTDADVPADRAHWAAEWARLHDTDTCELWLAAAQLQGARSPRSAGQSYQLWRGAEALALGRQPQIPTTAGKERRAQLVGLLNEAHSIATEIGDVTLLREIGSLAIAVRVILSTARGAQPTTLVNGAEQRRPHGLTEREIDVLSLLAEGLTNAQIAKRLYISPNTAGVHVSRIFAKLWGLESDSSGSGRFRARVDTYRLTADGSPSEANSAVRTVELVRSPDAEPTH